MTEKPPAGLPGFKQAPCLGCGRAGPVFESEQFSKVMGTRSASYLLIQVAEENAWRQLCLKRAVGPGSSRGQPRIHSEGSSSR